MPEAKQLRIVHILRAPLGGLYRHVLDATQGQIERGHAVGLIIDAGSFDDQARDKMAHLEPLLTLGLHTVAMPRAVSPLDVLATLQIVQCLKTLSPDVVHGHGAKGGAYARLARPWLPPHARCIYTPHGGSLHYRPETLLGKVFGFLETKLLRYTDTIIFESGFAKKAFSARFPLESVRHKIIWNGLHPEEFVAITPSDMAADLLFVGELRKLKGLDLLLEGMALYAHHHHLPLSLSVVGSGPDEAFFRNYAHELGLQSQVQFYGRLPMRQALTLGKVFLLPSRAESLPYVVLEAIAAGAPVLASRVGGVPEILGDASPFLFEPDSPAELYQALKRFFIMPAHEKGLLMQHNRQHVMDCFFVKRMVDDLLSTYAEVLAFPQGPRHH